MIIGFTKRVYNFFVRAFEKKMPTSGWHEFEIQGLKWKLCLDRYIDRMIATEKNFEPETTELVKSIVKPGMKILDIGANIGYFTNILAKQIGSTGKIYAFEPVSRYREQVQWHVNANNFTDTVKIFPFGLSDKATKLKMGMDNTSASLHWTPKTPPENYEEIELQRLDDIIEKEKISNIDFIKIDVDGHEPFFINGATEFFKHNSPIILIEFANLNLFVAGSNVLVLKEQIEKLGYVLYSEETKKPFISTTEFLIECGNYRTSANVWAIPNKIAQQKKSLMEL
jgi:FkbM family methyltransferase